MAEPIIKGLMWNLFLAAIPVVLGYALGRLISAKGGGRAVRLIAATAVGAAWLLFVPNTCYLLTEWRHFLFDPRWAPMLRAGRTDRVAMLATAKWALFFLGYSGSGVLLFVLAIRPVEAALKRMRRNAIILAPFFFLLVSLGVYLGLIDRLNSWDSFIRPSMVWAAMDDVVASPPRMVAIAVFAALLWITYEAVNLWVEALDARLGNRS